jgi:hypothetical protein
MLRNGLKPRCFAFPLSCHPQLNAGGGSQRPPTHLKHFCYWDYVYVSVRGFALFNTSQFDTLNILPLLAVV